MPDKLIKSRKEQFLIAKPRTPPEQPLDIGLLGASFLPALNETVREGQVNLSALASVLKQKDVSEALQLDLLETIGPADQPTILVAAMPPNRAQQLKEVYQGHLNVEPNAPLEMLRTDEPELRLASEWRSGLVPLDNEFTARITVEGESGEPVAGAIVYLLGSVWFAKEVTDQTGSVVLTLYGDSRETLRSLFINPQANYWNIWIDRPEIDPEPANNIIRPKKLGGAGVLPNFPQQEQYGWGQKAMKLDQAAEGTGQGIKIAIIDSGLATTHEDLQSLHVNADSNDFTDEEKHPSEWTNDVVGHGSHVAGVIAGQKNGVGIRGFAPDAELFIYKVFPGGLLSDLIKSLDRCIANGVHIVNLSLGSEAKSEIVEDKLAEAREAGVASIAAAGNSAGPVLYPAALENVLAVAAVGQFGAYPDNSYHAKQEHTSGDGKVFAGKFTCFGPQVDVCAPGVAIVSTVPVGTNGYASWDGTSMACPHVAGLAARILERRDDIRNLTGQERVIKLFDVIKSSARSIGLPAEYEGAGMPIAVHALGTGIAVGKDDEELLDQLADLLQQSVGVVKQLASKT